MKGKLEEVNGSIFKTSSVSISEMKEAINSCDMRSFLNKDTLTNYSKEKK